MKNFKRILNYANDAAALENLSRINLLITTQPHAEIFITLAIVGKMILCKSVFFEMELWKTLNHTLP